jgi:DNA-binding MltR family transcriptional regulator
MAKKRTRRTVHMEELVPSVVINSMKDGTDLACALICGAYIENATGSLLERHMIDDAAVSGSTGILNGPMAALSTASARTDLCFCLGLIDRVTYTNAKIIAKVRNQFAHSTTPLDFNDDHVQDECSKLHVMLGDPSDVGVYAGQLGALAQSFKPIKPLDQKTTERLLAVARRRLVLGTCWTLVVLQQAVYAAKTVQEAMDDTFYRPENVQKRFEAATKKGKNVTEAMNDAVRRHRRPVVFESTRSFLVIHMSDGKLFFNTVALEE